MAGEAPLGLKAILAAGTAGALKPFADRVGLKFRASLEKEPLAERKVAIITKALEMNCLSSEGLCAEQTAEARQQAATESELQAARLTALETDVAAVQSGVAAVGAQMGELVAALQQQTAAAAAQQAETKRQQKLQAEEEKAVELGSQVILFPAASLEEKRDDPDALRAEGQRVAAQLGVAASSITSAFLLKPKGNNPGPLVMRCSSVAAKRELLRARSQQRGGERVRLAPRLTPWQQQQKASSLQQFRDMRSKGEEVTFYCGWRLQRREGGQWVDVPATAAA